MLGTLVPRGFTDADGDIVHPKKMKEEKQGGG